MPVDPASDHRPLRGDPEIEKLRNLGHCLLTIVDNVQSQSLKSGPGVAGKFVKGELAPGSRGSFQGAKIGPRWPVPRSRESDEDRTPEANEYGKTLEARSKRDTSEQRRETPARGTGSGWKLDHGPGGKFPSTPITPVGELLQSENRGASSDKETAAGGAGPTPVAAGGNGTVASAPLEGRMPSPVPAGLRSRQDPPTMTAPAPPPPPVDLTTPSGPLYSNHTFPHIFCTTTITTTAPPAVPYYPPSDLPYPPCFLPPPCVCACLASPTRPPAPRPAPPLLPPPFHVGGREPVGPYAPGKAFSSRWEPSPDRDPLGGFGLDGACPGERPPTPTAHYGLRPPMAPERRFSTPCLPPPPPDMGLRPPGPPPRQHNACLSTSSTSYGDSISTSVSYYAATHASDLSAAAQAAHCLSSFHSSLLLHRHTHRHGASSSSSFFLFPPPPAQQVLQDDCLLAEILSHLLAHDSEDRRTLSVFSRVARRWRSLSWRDRYWIPIARSCFPVLALEAAPGESRLSMGGCEVSAGGSGWQDREGLSRWPWGEKRKVDAPHRDVVLRYGRCLTETRLCKLADWREGLRLSFEVFDAMDGLRLYSAEGPVKITPIADSNVTSLRLATHLRREVSRSFSAASRDAGLGRFGSVRDYFRYGHSPEYACALTVRITAFDVRTGRVALIYQASKSPKSSAGAIPSTYWQTFLPPGSLDVCDAWAWSSVHQASLGTLGASPAMEMRVGFFVGPEPGQGLEAEEKDRRYRIVARDWHPETPQQDASLMFLYFKSLDTLAIGKFVRGLLDG